jgi:hypothetical protein
LVSRPICIRVAQPLTSRLIISCFFNPNRRRRAQLIMAMIAWLGRSRSDA